MEINKKGKVIVIEGTDSSGKETQTKLLYQKLLNNKKNVKKISFPNYDSPACEPVKMYLAGEFGDNAEKINPYPISTMYAIDRYATYKKELEAFYKNGGIIVTDRYTTSNMVHQASKIVDSNEKTKYLEWLEDLEYNRIGIPKPDLVLFLNMPIEMAQKLMTYRKNKITGKATKDIHEKNIDYLKLSYENACQISKRQNWVEIKCLDEQRLKSIDEISEEILKLVNKIL